MGVEPFLVASSLVGVLAQRLVRVLCKNCHEAYFPTAEELREIGLTTEQVRKTSGGKLYRPVGCDHCNGGGYRGRAGIYEIMMLDDDIRQLILKNVDSGTIRKAASQKGMRSLMDDGAAKVLLGVTSVAEVLSVTQDDSA